MAFLGDLVVKMGANINPFQSAMKKAANVTAALKTSLNDMRTTAGVFAKLAAAIKATNNQMDRLINVTKSALSATQSLSAVELSQSKLRLQQLKMIQAQQQHNMKMQQMQAGGGGGGSMIGAGIAGGIAGSLANMGGNVLSSSVGAITDMGIGVVNLAANAEVMRVEFETLLGDVQKGTKMFAELEAFALRTSFDLTSAGEAARMMLAKSVDESELVGTLQMIGDLAMGDANKLGFLTKAYTDVFAKGKLKAQEMNQFAENGVNIRKALMDMLGKSSAEIMEMGEAGEISFGMVQAALISLTAEGGIFFEAMAKRNSTFKGQWDALTETVQGFGRDIGALVLPALKNIVEEMNRFAQAFRAMDGKAEFLADLFDATLSVAFEGIRENWARLMDDMVNEAIVRGKEIAMGLSGINFVKAAFGAGQAVGGKANEIGGREGGLEKAKNRLQEVLNRVQPDDNAPAAFNPLGGDAKLVTAQQVADAKKKRDVLQEGLDARGVEAGKDPGSEDTMRQMMSAHAEYNTLNNTFKKQRQQDGSGLKDLAGGVAEGAKGLFDRLSIAATSKLTDLAIKGDFLGSAITSMFGGPEREEQVSDKKEETRFAGAMQKGSAEAFSTIVAAMFGNKDPSVKATEKQTKEIVKAIKGQKGSLLNLVAEFVT